jgi:uncharacterized membrane protein (DUF4010 family)
MAVRNAVIVIVFVPEAAIVLGAPLGAIALVGIAVAVWKIDWQTTVDTELTSPFSLRNALTFGGLFLFVLVLSIGAENTFGASGFLATTFLAGLVSSGTATATAVTLLSSGEITYETAVTGVILGTTASILVKTAFAASISRELVRPVFVWNLVLITVGIAVSVPVLFL